MQARPAWIGNDIVDLAAVARPDRIRERFDERVFLPWERAAIRTEIDRWKFWSAKEAAFKAFAKVTNQQPFAPRRFEVVVDANGNTGLVKHGDQIARVSWSVESGWVHCLALIGKSLPGAAWRVSTSAADPKDAKEESKRARILALDLLREHGGAVEHELRRESQGPLRVYRCNELDPAWDVSISHDGRFASAAILFKQELVENNYA